MRAVFEGRGVVRMLAVTVTTIATVSNSITISFSIRIDSVVVGCACSKLIVVCVFVLPCLFVFFFLFSLPPTLSIFSHFPPLSLLSPSLFPHTSSPRFSPFFFPFFFKKAYVTLLNKLLLYYYYYHGLVKRLFNYI